jgi:hypothetical protein
VGRCPEALTGWVNSCELRRWAGLLVVLLSVLLFCPTAQAAPAGGALGALQQTASQTVAATVGVVAQQTDATLHQVAAPVQQLREPVPAVTQQVDQVVHDVAAPVVSTAVEGTGAQLPAVGHPVKHVEETVHATTDETIDAADLGSPQPLSTSSARASERGAPASTERPLAALSASSSTRASRGIAAGGGHSHAAASLSAPVTAVKALESAACCAGQPAQQAAPADRASDSFPAPAHEPSPSPAPRPSAGGGGASSVSLFFGGAAVLLAALALCAGGLTRRLSSIAGRWHAVPFVSALERPD